MPIPIASLPPHAHSSQVWRAWSEREGQKLIGRYYDPGAGQFFSVDPDVAETGQPYAYTGDDPVNAIDPLGLSWYDPSWAHKAYHEVRKDLHSKLANAVLNRISKVAGVVAAGASAVAVVTAGIPVVGEVAEGVSLAAGSVAVTADLANCLGSHCDATQLALDAAALIPGVAATRLGRVAADAADTVELASTAAHASANSLMDAQTVLANFRSFQRGADTIGFGLSAAGWGVSVANSNF
jgi:RHS repeat-associated protein